MNAIVPLVLSTLMGFSFQMCDALSIKLVIFDHAGTTIDCGVLSPALAFRQLFEKHGISITMQEARAPMGLFKKDHIREILKMERVARAFESVHERVWNEDDVETLFQDFIPMQLASIAQHSELIAGTIKTVQLLKDNGIAIASTTGFDREMNKLLLSHAKEQGYTPDHSISSSDVHKGRPYWYMVQHMMQQAGVTDPPEVLKVGDTTGDILEGKAMAHVAAHGTWAIGVSATSNYVGKSWDDLKDTPGDTLFAEMEASAQKLYAAGADYVVPTIDSIPAMIDLINARLARNEMPREVALDFLS